MRERFRLTVELRPVDQSNWYACTQLEVAEEQKNVFPVPVVYWLAESAYCGFTPLAMYTGEQLVGFAVCAIDPEDGSNWIMAYMIDHKFQHRGLGRSGMEELIRYIKKKHSCDKIVLGHRIENILITAAIALAAFYIHFANGNSKASGIARRICRRRAAIP